MTPKGIIIHHPAMSQATIDSNKGKKLVDIIRYDHVHNRGWLDIGYHYFIHKDTDNKFKVFDGRSDKMAGAHCYGFNDWLGVSVAYGLGTNPPEDQLLVLAQLISTLCKTYNIPLDSSHIKGHRDMPGHQSNECPGNQMYSKIPYVIELAKKCQSGQRIPDQKVSNKTGSELKPNNITININNESVSGLLLSDSAFIHVSYLNKIKIPGYKFVVTYIPGTDKEKHHIDVKLEQES